MSRAVPPPPEVSRRALILFALLAPACLLAVAGIVGVLQYRQFQALVSPQAAFPAPAWTQSDSARQEALKVSLVDFSEGRGPDTVPLSPADLTLLAATTPAVTGQGIRLRIVGEDSLLVSESSRQVDALQGRLSGVFKLISPVKDGWLNARVEGLPDWTVGVLSLVPERGFLNGAKVPRAALTKRGGLSPEDYLSPGQLPAYAAFLAALDTVRYEGGNILVIRKENYELRITN
jgi:hypothetical protein